MYQQCHLEKGNVSHTAYIPKKFAKVGLRLNIKINGNWEDGWIVVSKHGVIDSPPDTRKMARQHKKNTGDSLPK